ncbi:MAG: hypothetical protein ACE147_07970 [Candidatus Methylomirabilales bacterium]
MALRLKQMGVRRVRPLEGGLEAWRSRGFPVEAIPAAALPVAYAAD